ncbi:1600_t:CDS:1 [Acaulospora morrowiae]|uniref:1600_t:CDS:1 n=1 Tax=Acaulospora morrowiae TaxID=94023 RepID=A0A9N9GCD7_9GLOM|nr:1600_t:CDS:1 [Acaulospora morrowiae]
MWHQTYNKKSVLYKVAVDFDTATSSDNHNCIIIIDGLFKELKWSSSCPGTMTADCFRIRGNEHFVSKEFTMAISLYSNGPKLYYAFRIYSIEDFLRLNRFKWAFCNTEIALEND